MSKSSNIGVNNIAKKIKTFSIGGGNLDKKVNKAYIGDTTGTAKEFIENEAPLEKKLLIYGSDTDNYHLSYSDDGFSTIKDAGYTGTTVFTAFFFYDGFWYGVGDNNNIYRINDDGTLTLIYNYSSQSSYKKVIPVGFYDKYAVGFGVSSDTSDWAGYFTLINAVSGKVTSGKSSFGSGHTVWRSINNRLLNFVPIIRSGSQYYQLAMYILATNGGKYQRGALFGLNLDTGAVTNPNGATNFTRTSFTGTTNTFTDSNMALVLYNGSKWYDCISGSYVNSSTANSSYNCIFRDNSGYKLVQSSGGNYFSRSYTTTTWTYNAASSSINGLYNYDGSYYYRTTNNQIYRATAITGAWTLVRTLAYMRIATVYLNTASTLYEN